MKYFDKKEFMQFFYLSFLLVLILFPLPNFAQRWTGKKVMNDYTFYSIHFISDKVGYAVGDSGSILRTEDGGLSWEVLNTNTNARLSEIYFIDSDTGFVVGDNGLILKTEDAGESWEEKELSTTETLKSIYFLNPEVGFIVGDNGLILKTEDGGENWITKDSKVTFLLKKIKFIDEQTGYAVGFWGIILKTKDAGESWEKLDSKVIFPLEDIFFHQNKIFSIGLNGIILKSEDGGENWEEQQSNTNQWLYGIYFNEQETGYIVGNFGTILRTEDGGENWEEQQSNTNQPLYNVTFVNENMGYAVGKEGTLLKFTQPEIQLNNAENLLLNGESIRWGEVILNEDEWLEIELKNIGTDTLEIREIKTSENILYEGISSFSVNPQSSTTIQLKINTSLLGSQEGFLKIKSNDQRREVYEINLKGSVVEFIRIPNPPQSFQVEGVTDSSFTARLSWNLTQDIDSSVIERASVGEESESFQVFKAINNNGSLFQETFINQHLLEITYFYRIKNYKNGVSSEYSEIKGISFTGGLSTIITISENDLDNLKVYPNPSDGIFYIDNLPESIPFLISDATGKILEEGASIENTSINLSQKSEGVYFIHFLIPDKKLSFRLVKQ